MADQSTYPATLDAAGNLRAVVPAGTAPEGFEDYLQLLGDAVSKIQAALGLNPAASEANVDARIAAAEILLALKANSADVTTEIQAALDGLIDGAPGTLDTLNEISAALADDEDFAATMVAALATKVGSDGTILQVVKLTQASYDALTPVATTLYIIE